ncbi:MAG: UDP-N-acetylmuramoyl-tripeptide--D-alanyl-D-alanine ligase [bacterium]
MIRAPAGKIAEAVGGRVAAGSPSVHFEKVVTDSRADCAGALFVPLVGERRDGHDFIADAAGKGAAGCFSSRGAAPPGAPEGFVVIEARDTLEAYQKLAAWNRGRCRAVVAAVTGSCGKTTTKEMIRNVMEARLGEAVVGTAANENNEIGVPRALLRMGAGTKAAALEFGMRRPGDVSLLAKLARPDCGVITNVEKTHIGLLGSEQAIADAKGELLECLDPGGVAVLNADNPWCGYLGKKTAAAIVKFGVRNKAEVTAREISYGIDGVSFVLDSLGTRVPVRVPLLGEVNVYNALAAGAVAIVMGYGAEELRAGLARQTFQEGRMRKVMPDDGKLILDDTYNSNPASLRRALELLGALPWNGRRVAVLGDMLELGDFSRDEHRAVGREAAVKYCDLLITFGTESKHIGDGAQHAGMDPEMVLHFDSISLFRRRALGLLLPDDLILVKGSRGMKMEEIVRLIAGENG